MSFRLKLLAIFAIILAVLLNFGGYLGHIVASISVMSNVPPLVVTARAKLALGADRQEALETFSDAWFHADCTLANGDGYDLFFYGQKLRDSVQILIVRSDKSKVTFIGLEENYRLAIYERCVPADVFEAE